MAKKIRRRRGFKIDENTQLESVPEKVKDPSVLTFFVIMVPSLLLAMTTAVPDLWIRLMFQAVLLLLQVVLVKQLVDNFYGK